MWWNVSEGITGDENAKVKHNTELQPPAAEKTDISHKCGLKEASSARTTGDIRKVKTWYSVSNTFEFACESGSSDQTKTHAGGFDFETDSNMEGLYFMLLTSIWLKTPSSSHSQQVSVIWGWNTARNVPEVSIPQTSLEQSKLPVCAPRADDSNPNTNFRLVNQLKAGKKKKVRWLLYYSHPPPLLLSSIGINCHVCQRAANSKRPARTAGSSLALSTLAVLMWSFWRLLLEWFCVVLLNLQINCL